MLSSVIPESTKPPVSPTSWKEEKSAHNKALWAQGKRAAFAPDALKPQVLRRIERYRRRLIKLATGHQLDDARLVDTIKRLKLLAACAQPIVNSYDLKIVMGSIAEAEPLIQGARKKTSDTDTPAIAATLDQGIMKAVKELGGLVGSTAHKVP